MNPDRDTQLSLIPAHPADLARAGAKSLTARGRADLLKRERAEYWLRKGLEFRDSASDADEELIRTIIPRYIKQVSASISPETAAKNLGMTLRDQDRAHTIQFFLSTFAKHMQEDANDDIEVLQKRNEMLTEAFRCFENGHQNDPMHPELIYWLAECYLRGEGVQRDEEKSIDLFWSAAGMGHARAQTVMGNAHAQNGFRCLPKDDAQAAKWYEMAAEQGDNEALGMFCFLLVQRRIGMKQDHAAAAQLLRQAGARGNETAQHNLNVLFQEFGDPYGDNDSATL